MAATHEKVHGGKMFAQNHGTGKLGKRVDHVGVYLVSFLVFCLVAVESEPVLGLEGPLEESKVTLSDFLKTVDQHNVFTTFAFTVGITILTLGLGFGGTLLFKNVRELKADMRTEIDNAKNTMESAKQLLEKKAMEVDALQKALENAKSNLENEMRQYTAVGQCFITSEIGVVLYKLSQADPNSRAAMQEVLKPHGERFLSWTLQRAAEAKPLFTESDSQLPLLAMLAVYEAIAHKRLGRTARALQVLEQDVLKREEAFRRIDKASLAKPYYNAACYACLSDEGIKKVLDYLETATELSGGYRQMARTDPDLARAYDEPRFKQITTTISI